MLPVDPKLKASGFKKAAIATNTAASPTKLWMLQLNHLLIEKLKHTQNHLKNLL